MNDWHDKPLCQHHADVFFRWKRERPDQEKLATRLSWLRSQSPEAFRYVCQTDIDCASIAVQRKWVFDADHDPKLGWGDRKAVAESIRKARGRLPTGKDNFATPALIACLRAALERYAPDNLDLLG